MLIFFIEGIKKEWLFVSLFSGNYFSSYNGWELGQKHCSDRSLEWPMVECSMQLESCKALRFSRLKLSHPRTKLNNHLWLEMFPIVCWVLDTAWLTRSDIIKLSPAFHCMIFISHRKVLETQKCILSITYPGRQSVGWSYVLDKKFLEWFNSARKPMKFRPNPEYLAITSSKRSHYFQMLKC